MLLFMTYLSIFLLLCPVTLAKNHTDHLALLSIKSTITLDPQNVLETWNASLHYCQWQGVTCGRRHLRVTKLDLGSRGIVGQVPASLSNYTRLKDLWLSYNKLGGKFPHHLSSLVNLMNITFHDNNFTGRVPSLLVNLTSLISISAANNPLGGSIPHALCQLHNLQIIEFGFN
ncbi:putative non-specific serine/threonine protein kinase [Helianthus annuus]|nr:putative non-specific serine/threonine protein kinase [Helianthus annuus]